MPEWLGRDRTPASLLGDAKDKENSVFISQCSQIITNGRNTRSPYSQKGTKLCGLRNSSDSNRRCCQVSMSEKVSSLYEYKIHKYATNY
jgi:hypothetical protein